MGSNEIQKYIMGVKKECDCIIPNESIYPEGSMGHMMGIKNNCYCNYPNISICLECGFYEDDSTESNYEIEGHNSSNKYYQSIVNCDNCNSYNFVKLDKLPDYKNDKPVNGNHIYYKDINYNILEQISTDEVKKIIKNHDEYIDNMIDKYNFYYINCLYIEEITSYILRFFKKTKDLTENERVEFTKYLHECKYNINYLTYGDGISGLDLDILNKYGMVEENDYPFEKDTIEDYSNYITYQCNTFNIINLLNVDCFKYDTQMICKCRNIETGEITLQSFYIYGED